MKRSIFLLLTTLLCLTAMAQDENETFAGRIKVMGYGQVYAEASYANDNITKTTFGINKIELVGIGKITEKWTAGLTVQFNSQVMVKDLYMQYAFMPELRLKLGQFKTPFSHENQYPPFMNPLATGGSMPTIYFAGMGMNPLYQGTGGRDMGIEISGDLFEHIVSYRLAMMNGQGLNHLDLNKGKLMGGSLYIRPTKGLALHTSYLGGKQAAMAAAKGIDAGEQYTSHRASAGIIAHYKPISVTAEYMFGQENNIKGMGAYLTTAIHLPKRVDLIIAGDYLQTDMDKSGKLFTATVGVDKWFYGKCRMELQYRYTHPTSDEMPLPKGHNLRTQLQFYF